MVKELCKYIYLYKKYGLAMKIGMYKEKNKKIQVKDERRIETRYILVVNLLNFHGFSQ